MGWAPDVIYLDQYGEVPEWEAHAAKAGARLLVLDDLGAAKRGDVIVRPYGGETDGEDAIVLRGPAYLPLSSHVTSLAHRAPSRASDTRLKLNVCFGGSDPTGETGKALQAAGGLNEVAGEVGAA